MGTQGKIKQEIIAGMCREREERDRLQQQLENRNTRK